MRTLSELLAGLLYFTKHPDKAEMHLTPDTLKQAAAQAGVSPTHPHDVRFLESIPGCISRVAVAPGSPVRDEAMESLNEMMLSQWNEYPQQHAMLRVISKLVGWPVPEQPWAA